VVRSMRAIETRFFEKVNPSSDGCWEWQAKKNNKGYGMLGRGRAGEGFALAHRVSYEIANGEIPKGKWVLHHCDNRGCVNPKHLFLGTPTDNVHDMDRKGRRGLNPQDAYAILWEWASGVSRRKVAVEHGVSLHVVKNIAQRRRWNSLSSLDHD
jgi:HNH endonuclease